MAHTAIFGTPQQPSATAKIVSHGVLGVAVLLIGLHFGAGAVVIGLVAVILHAVLDAPVAARFARI